MSTSRRGFLKGAAVAAGAAALASVPHKAEAAAKQPKWDMTYDVVVVGYGGAGAAAAIAAHDAGSKVLILEKMHEGGGNTAVSSGGYICPSDYDQAIKYIKKLFTFSHSDMDEQLVEVFAKGIMTTTEYVASLQEGLDQRIYGYAGFQWVEGSESIRKYNIRGKKRGGDNLFDAFRNAVETVRKIPVLLNSPAIELYTNADGDITGVLASVDGVNKNIRANKGVVLASGGFEYNLDMYKNYVKGYPIYGLGNPGNTGDGIIMAQKAGAQLWHMTGTSCPLGVRLPGLKSCIQVNMLAPSHIWVDQDGKRFINEKGLDNHACLLAVDYFDSIQHKFPRIPCWMVFDEKARVKGPISGGATSGYAINRENYVWSKDNSAEIANGVIKKANTLDELAKIINVPADALKASIDKWNVDVKAGGDTIHGRKVYASADGKPVFEGREAPILSETIDEKGPYYAVEMFPTMLNTQGGPKRDIHARCLDPYNRPIQRLYVIGELGSVWGLLYQGAGNNAESIVFGDIAGKHVASLKSW